MSPLEAKTIWSVPMVWRNELLSSGVKGIPPGSLEWLLIDGVALKASSHIQQRDSNRLLPHYCKRRERDQYLNVRQMYCSCKRKL